MATAHEIPDLQRSEDAITDGSGHILGSDDARSGYSPPGGLRGPGLGGSADGARSDADLDGFDHAHESLGEAGNTSSVKDLGHVDGNDDEGYEEPTVGRGRGITRPTEEAPEFEGIADDRSHSRSKPSSGFGDGYSSSDTSELSEGKTLALELRRAEIRRGKARRAPCRRRLLSLQYTNLGSVRRSMEMALHIRETKVCCCRRLAVLKTPRIRAECTSPGRRIPSARYKSYLLDSGISTAGHISSRDKRARHGTCVSGHHRF